MPRATAKGVDIEYESFGDPAHETVLLINGLGSQMIRWPEPFCALLVARGLRVARFDNRDVGLSTWLGTSDAYRLEDMAGDAAAVLDAIGADAAHVVGVSMGAMIAQTFAFTYPQRTLSLTSIMSSTGNLDLPGATPEASAVISQPPPDPRADFEAVVAYEIHHARTIGSPDHPWDEAAIRARAVAEYGRAYNPSGVGRQLSAIRATADRRSRLATITAPTVVLHGLDDPVVAAEGAVDTAAAIPGAELRLIPGMGHDMPPVLYPTFVDAIARAVERAPRPRPRPSLKEPRPMADDAPKLTTRLEPQDEYTHTPDTASNYNESMYFNVFDPSRKVGGWFRLGNRPNEGYAEMSVCLYLPGGRVGFMFGRPKIQDNAAMDAGGLKIEVVEPFKRLRVTFTGKVCLLERPFEMAEPSKAFRDNPNVPCEVVLDYEGVSPMFGGETVREDGVALDIDPEKSFAKAHYEQHVAARGHFTVDDDRYEIDGYGLRDKSWGPRYWSAINWYRWCPMNFGPDFGMMLSIVAGEAGAPRQGGMVFKDGVYDLISECAIDSDWDAHGYQTGLRARVRTRAGQTYEVAGRVLSLIPLRNRRKTPDGRDLVTRITEGMTEYRCDGQIGYGLSEYLDQIVDGQPTGMLAERA